MSWQQRSSGGLHGDEREGYYTQGWIVTARITCQIIAQVCESWQICAARYLGTFYLLIYKNISISHSSHKVQGDGWRFRAGLPYPERYCETPRKNVEMIDRLDNTKVHLLAVGCSSLSEVYCKSNTGTWAQQKTLLQC